MTKKALPRDPRDYYIQAMPKITLMELAKTYRARRDCTFKKLEARCRKENWVQLRREYNEKTTSRAMELASEATAQEVAKTWHAHNLECYDLAENLKRIGQQLMRQYVKVSRVDGIEVTTVECSPSEYKLISSTLMDLCDRQRLYLNIEKGKPVQEPPPLQDVMKPYENDPIIRALTIDVKGDWSDA